MNDSFPKSMTMMSDLLQTYELQRWLSSSEAVPQGNEFVREEKEEREIVGG